jgi:hypothetical protein
MTTLEKVRDERIETLYAAWDAQDLDSIQDGAVLRFEWTPPGATFTYAVLRAGGLWWATGHSANGLPTEDIIAWLIGKDVSPAEVVWLS